MKRSILILLSLLCLGATAQQKNVLFVGNSYTEVNNLPLLVSNVCQSLGYGITYSSSTPGGYYFRLHCSGEAMQLICQGGWDVVVLQEQSQLPSFPESQVTTEVFPYATQLVDSIYAHSPCAEPMFYMTWGRKNGDTQNASSFPVLGTYEGMDSMLYERYMYMAQVNDAAVSPVGRVWRYLRNHSEIELYQSDNSHPSLAGSYAAACTFGVMLFHFDPTHITFVPNNLDPIDAMTIRSAVKSVVFDSLSRWQRPLPEADFSWTSDNLQLHLSNNSHHASDYLWNWGDGSTSEGDQTSHAYAIAGTYNVTLTASRHCLSDSLTQQIVVEGNSTEGIEGASASPRLYPNPATDMLRIEAPLYVKARVTDCTGREVLPNSTRNVLDLSQLPQGIYLVRIVTMESTFTEKVVKR